MQQGTARLPTARVAHCGVGEESQGHAEHQQQGAQEALGAVGARYYRRDEMGHEC